MRGAFNRCIIRVITISGLGATRIEQTSQTFKIIGMPRLQPNCSTRSKTARISNSLAGSISSNILTLVSSLQTRIRGITVLEPLQAIKRSIVCRRARYQRCSGTLKWPTITIPCLVVLKITMFSNKMASLKLVACRLWQRRRKMRTCVPLNRILILSRNETTRVFLRAWWKTNSLLRSPRGQSQTSLSFQKVTLECPFTIRTISESKYTIGTKPPLQTSSH